MYCQSVLGANASDSGLDSVYVTPTSCSCLALWQSDLDNDLHHPASWRRVTAAASKVGSKTPQWPVPPTFAFPHCLGSAPPNLNILEVSTL